MTGGRGGPDEQEDQDSDDERSESVAEEDPGWPWSFILLVVAGAIYLIFRFIELFINIFT